MLKKTKKSYIWKNGWIAMTRHLLSFSIQVCHHKLAIFRIGRWWIKYTNNILKLTIIVYLAGPLAIPKIYFKNYKFTFSILLSFYGALYISGLGESLFLISGVSLSNIFWKNNSYHLQRFKNQTKSRIKHASFACQIKNNLFTDVAISAAVLSAIKKWWIHFKINAQYAVWRLNVFNEYICDFGD